MIEAGCAADRAVASCTSRTDRSRARIDRNRSLSSCTSHIRATAPADRATSIAGNAAPATFTSKAQLERGTEHAIQVSQPQDPDSRERIGRQQRGRDRRPSTSVNTSWISTGSPSRDNLISDSR